MNREEYEAIASRLASRPPDPHHADGQRFRIGDRVKIVNPQSWFSKKALGKIFVVEYSYHQKYPEMSDRDRHKRTYSLRSVDDGNRTSWYDEEELEIVADILDAEYIEEP